MRIFSIPVIASAITNDIVESLEICRKGIKSSVGDALRGESNALRGESEDNYASGGIHSGFETECSKHPKIHKNTNVLHFFLFRVTQPIREILLLRTFISTC